MSKLGAATDTLFVLMPPGLVNPVHRNPVVQLVQFVRGTGNWTAGDNDRRYFTAGTLMLGDDFLANKGHLSSTVGSEAVELLVMQYANIAPSKGRPCWLK